MHDAPETRPSSPTRVVILGGGFGGIYAALELEKVLARRTDVEVTLVARDNFFLFTPMLHEVAASDLELSTIVSPLRKMLRRVGTFVGSVEGIEKKVRVALDWTLDLCFAKDFASVTPGLGLARSAAVSIEPPQAGAA